MENIRFSARSIVGRERLGLIVFALITLLAGDVSSKLLAAPQGTLRSEDAERPQEGQTPAFGNAAPALDWESQARLHRGLEGSSGTLTLSQDGVAFRPTKGSLLNLPFLEIQTFDLLTPQRLVITGYENRSWHRHGEKKYRFDLSVAMPPDVAAELARRVAKPVRNGNPNLTATTFATIPARHRTLLGGTNGTLRFDPDGIDYLTTSGKSGRAWLRSDIQTLANPDPFHLRMDGYRETFTFELKQPMSRTLFDRLWDQIDARDLNRLDLNGSNENRLGEPQLHGTDVNSKQLKRKDTRHAN